MELDRNKIVLVTSTKKDGNMSFVKGDIKNTLKNREEFLNENGISLNEIVALQTPHESSVYVAAKKDLGKGASEGQTAIAMDALITNQKQVFLFLLTADCLPISLYDRANEAIGLLHASRHNINSIITSTVEKMQSEFKTKPKDLIVEIGPSIGPCHYQTDLWKTAANELTKAGISKENIKNTKKCTYHTLKYYSHRRFVEKKLKEDYRIATILGMRG